MATIHTPVPRTTETSRPVPARFRIPSLVWAGLALLTLTLVGARWGMHLPARDSVPTSGTAKQPELLPRRAVCFGHVDTEQGIIPLYPLQPGRVLNVEVKDNEDVK